MLDKSVSVQQGGYRSGENSRTCLPLCVICLHLFIPTTCPDRLSELVNETQKVTGGHGYAEWTQSCHYANVLLVIFVKDTQTNWMEGCWGSKSVNVTEHTMNKTLIHYLLTDHRCPGHIRHQIFIGNAGCLTMKTPMIPRCFTGSWNYLFCFHCFDWQTHPKNTQPNHKQWPQSF